MRDPRRLLASSALAMTIAAVFGGCATFTTAAATVEGTAIDAGTFQERLADVADAGIAQVSIDELTGTVQADGARAVLGLMIRVAATTQFLDAAGESITAADRDAIVAEIDPADLEGLSDGLRTLLVDNAAAAAAVGRVGAPSADVLERRYAQSPASVGVLCVRHILVETQSEADDVVAELESGTEFAELAAARSTDEGSAPQGGALGTDERACLELSTARQSLDPAFVAGAFAARPDRPTAPVQSQFGWHVILARPYDEVAASIDALYESGSALLAVDAYLAGADVTVDSRYGAWDPAAQSIVALG